MSKKRSSASKAKTRTPRFQLDNHEPETGAKVQSRLFVDDEYLRAKIALTGRSEPEVLRTLVRKGVRMDRLERASKGPNINILLKVIDDELAGHFAKLERRLSAEFHTLRRLVATAVVLSTSSMRLLEFYTAQAPPPPLKAVEERRRLFFTALNQQFITEAESMLEGMLEERETLLTTLAESELITTLKDSDLDAALDTSKWQPEDGETPEPQE